MKKDDDAAKLRQARRIVTEDRRCGNDYMLWALHLYQPRQIYAALLARGYVWLRQERKWEQANQ